MFMIKGEIILCATFSGGRIELLFITVFIEELFEICVNVHMQ